MAFLLYHSLATFAHHDALKLYIVDLVPVATPLSYLMIPRAHCHYITEHQYY
jgi:hypothetical protein